MKIRSQKIKRNEVPDKLCNQSLTKVKSRKIIDSLKDDKLDGNGEIADISAHYQQSKGKKIKLKKNLKKVNLEVKAVQDAEDENYETPNILTLFRRPKKLDEMKKIKNKKQNLKKVKHLDVQAVQDAKDENVERPNILTLHRQPKEKQKQKIKIKKNLKKVNHLDVQAVQDSKDKNVERPNILTSHRQPKEKEKKKIKNLKKAVNVQMQSVHEASPKERKKKIKRKQQNLKNIEDLETQDELQNVMEGKEDPCSNEEAELDTKKKTKSKGMLIQRSEASLNISEFNLNEVGKEKVELTDLIKSLNPSLNQTKKQLKNTAKLQRLAVPLSKPQLEKIKRTVAYENVCDQVAKWDPIVRSNRLADQIVFPLKKPEFRLDTIDKISESFVTKTPLEEEVSKLLNNSENVFHIEKQLTATEEQALQAMSLDEAKIRHGELMKHRALLSYKEAKARRQNKIKSKKYHRLLKKEKLRNMIKEFEILQKVDPAAAQEKYMEADKLRILERMTLKHRNTGKWAMKHKMRAKYNPDSRSSLKEDLLIGKKLREKLPDIPVLAKKPSEIDVSDHEDPYFNSGHHTNLIEDCTSEKNLFSNEINTDIRDKEDDLAVKQNINSEDLQTTEINANEKESVQKPNTKPKEKEKENSIENDIGFSTEVTFLKSMIPDDITAGDEGLDDVEGDTMNIRQAFADEGLIAEFREEKKAAEEAKKPQGLDLLLPGWGSWGGPSIKPSQQKRKRFLIEPDEPAPKKNTLGSVIINEEADKKLAPHQVSHMPYPFINVHQFNSHIRQPIGNTWNPETSFHKLIAPKVITRAGKIIEPMDSEDVILEKKEEKHHPNKFVRKNLKKDTMAKAF